MIYFLLSLVNFILFLIRYRIIRKNQLLIVDPILLYHGVWAVNFFIKGLNFVEFEYSLSSSLMLFVSLWGSLAIGLWVGAYFFKLRSYKQNVVNEKDKKPQIGTYIFALIIINIICLVAAGSIIYSGYPIEALFIFRKFYKLSAELKQLVIITFLSALQLVLVAKILPFIKKVKTLVFVLIMSYFPGFLEAAFVAGRTPIVVPIILSLFIYLNIKQVRYFSVKQGVLICTILVLVLSIFVLMDIARTFGTIKTPEQEQFLMIVKYIQGPLDTFEAYNILNYSEKRGEYPGLETFYFIFHQLRRLGINYGQAPEDYTASDLYYGDLTNYVSTMFTVFLNDYGRFGGCIVLFIMGIFSIYITKKYNKESNNLFWLMFSVVTNFQLLWSGQLYYMFGSSLFMFYVIWAYIINKLSKIHLRM